ncbi:MAG: hypothetical protein SF123_01965 [Chloroflexota bacterium]|nr:hypothetical protein [Chloroflexota bacterium]
MNQYPAIDKPHAPISIWDFQRTLSQRLLVWSGVSTVLGIVMALRGKFWRGVGSQFVGWAVVNAAIALVGQYVTQRRRAQLDDPELAKHRLREAANLKRLLWINAVLDVFYMLGGAFMMGRRQSGAQTRGTGFGIILQGLFLLVFDIIHALCTPTWPWGGSDPR